MIRGKWNKGESESTTRISYFGWMDGNLKRHIKIFWMFSLWIYTFHQHFTQCHVDIFLFAIAPYFATFFHSSSYIHGAIQYKKLYDIIGRKDEKHFMYNLFNELRIWTRIWDLTDWMPFCSLVSSYFSSYFSCLPFFPVLLPYPLLKLSRLSAQSSCTRRFRIYIRKKLKPEDWRLTDCDFPNSEATGEWGIFEIVIKWKVNDSRNFRFSSHFHFIYNLHSIYMHKNFFLVVGSSFNVVTFLYAIFFPVLSLEEEWQDDYFQC